MQELSGIEWPYPQFCSILPPVSWTFILISMVTCRGTWTISLVALWCVRLVMTWEPKVSMVLRARLRYQKFFEMSCLWQAQNWERRKRENYWHFEHWSAGRTWKLLDAIGQYTLGNEFLLFCIAEVVKSNLWSFCRPTLPVFCVPSLLTSGILTLPCILVLLSLTL